MTTHPQERAKEASAASAKRPLSITLAVTAAVTLLSYASPLEYAATTVGAAFIVAVVLLVLRHDTGTIRHYGLSLGGVLEPHPLAVARLAKEGGRALAWALGAAALVVGPFVLGFRWYWHARGAFHLRAPLSLMDDLFGQMLVIALPEEAYFRGYLMTALDDAWGTPWNVWNARLGWGWIASSAIFAVGHVLTEPEPQRLAVFFPALAFGWLRARTQGIGAPALFHALCNVLASTLGRGYVLGR